MLNLMNLESFVFQKPSKPHAASTPSAPPYAGTHAPQVPLYSAPPSVAPYPPTSYAPSYPPNPSGYTPPPYPHQPAAYPPTYPPTSSYPPQSSYPPPPHDPYYYPPGIILSPIYIYIFSIKTLLSI